MEILCISNGHGEDLIAARICIELEKLGVSAIALPLVGVGHAYQPQIPIIEGVTETMPSGGFVRMDGKQLWRDMQSGLAKLTWKQLQVAWHWSKQAQKSAKNGQKRLILAVGDIVPLLFAWLPSLCGGCDYVFIATAKSEYYWRDRDGILPDLTKPFGGSSFYPWERSLMHSRHCKAVFVRDQLTADLLRKSFRLPVLHFGNPMMDGLEPQGLDFGIQADAWVITLLPGSRIPEAYENWNCLLTGAQIITRTIGKKINFLAAIASSLDLEILDKILAQRGWQKRSESIYKYQNARLQIVFNGFSDCLHQCHLGLAMAGTATEQLVGLGKPVITIPGAGPQFTEKFAQEQARLLGLSVKFIDKPAQIGEELQELLSDPDYFQDAVSNGQERMGLPGASQSIAKYLVEEII